MPDSDVDEDLFHARPGARWVYGRGTLTAATTPQAANTTTAPPDPAASPRLPKQRSSATRRDEQLATLSPGNVLVSLALDGVYVEQRYLIDPSTGLHF